AHHPAAAPDYHRPGPRIMDLHFAVGSGVPTHKSGILAGQNAFTEDPVGLGHHLAERQRHAGQAAEQSVQLRHQHGGSHPLAGNVTQDEEKLPIGGYQVAIVAADWADRSIVITGLPATSAQVRLRQKSSLYL